MPLGWCGVLVIQFLACLILMESWAAKALLQAFEEEIKNLLKQFEATGRLRRDKQASFL